MPRKAKTEQAKTTAEEPVNVNEATKIEEVKPPAPAKLVQCKSMKYSEDVLAKKRELALKALAVARKNREERMKAQIEEELKLKELQAKKEAKAKPKPAPVPEPAQEPEEEAEPEPAPVPEKVKSVAKAEKQKKPKPPVYQDSSDSDESDDEAYVLTKKKTIKKMKALKAEHKNRHNYEVSEQALLKQWAAERYNMAMNSLFPTHHF